MALALKQRREFPSDLTEKQSVGFETVFLEEAEDDSFASCRDEEQGENIFPQIINVESIDPSQFLQEEMFVEEERCVF